MWVLTVCVWFLYSSRQMLLYWVTQRNLVYWLKLKVVAYAHYCWQRIRHIAHACTEFTTMLRLRQTVRRDTQGHVGERLVSDISRSATLTHLRLHASASDFPLSLRQCFHDARDSRLMLWEWLFHSMSSVVLHLVIALNERKEIIFGLLR